MTCVVCHRPIAPGCTYCGRCRPLLEQGPDKLKRRAALQAAYDPAIDAFRCHHCGVVLELDDYSDPFHLCFDHLVPVKSSELVVSSELFNLMKGAFTPDEFRAAVHALARHLDGEPFDRDAIRSEHWARLVRPPRPPGPREGELTKVVVEACVVCGEPPVRWSPYCPVCRALIFGRKGNHTPRAEALRRAWTGDGFACHYTGVVLEDRDRRSPWYVYFDHAVPGEEGTMVVSAAWVNAMKTALSEDEFKAVVREYDRYLREGGEFDRNCAKFEYWRRSRARRIWR